MISATYICIPAANDAFLWVEREIFGFVNAGVDLIRTGFTWNADLFISRILHNFIWHTLAQEWARDIFYDVVLFRCDTGVTTTRGSSENDPTWTVYEPDSRTRLIRGRWHKAFTPVLDGSRAKTGPLDHILCLGKFAALGVTPKVIQGVTFC